MPLCMYVLFANMYNYDAIIVQNYSEFHYPSHSAGVKTNKIFKEHNSARKTKFD